MRRLIAGCVGVVIGAAAAAMQAPAAVPVTAPQETLLHSARAWEAHERSDLARLALEKLSASLPDSADTLQLLGELCLRMGDIDCAKDVLARLTGSHPGAAQTRSFATALRLATTERLQYASIRRLLQTGHGAEARAALDALLPDGAPGGYASLEYYRLLAAMPGGWDAAQRGVRELAGAHADDPRYRLALARMLLGNAATRSEGRRVLAQLRGRDDLAAADAGAMTAATTTPAAAARSRAPERNATPAPSTPQAPSPAALAIAVAAAEAAAAWRQAADEAALAGMVQLAAARASAAAAFAAQDFEAVIPAATRCEEAGSSADAGTLLATAARLDPQSHWLFASRVRWLTAHGEPGAALALLDDPGAVTAAAGDAGLRATALDARAAAELGRGENAAARTDLDAAHALAPQDAWITLHLARRLAAAGDPQGGRQLWTALPDATAADPDWNFAAALYLESLDDRAAARAALTGVPQAQWSDGMHALLARLDAGDRPAAPGAPAAAPSFVTAGIAHTNKPGDGGSSQLDAWQTLSDWRCALAHGDTLDVRADVVHLDAGTLPAGGAIPLVGTIQAAGAAGVAAAARATTSATGVAAGVGYASALVSGDIGTTPLGFPVTHVVGGIRYTPSAGPIDFSAGFARRAVTSSLLSYAGMRDPVSGRVWGGVTETGPRLQAGIYRSAWSVQLAARASQLEGTHVLANRFVGERFAADRRLVSLPGLDFYVGLTATHWNYSESLLNYTYGSGGYYSPQSYLSVGLPLILEGSQGRWSYRTRLTPAHSTSDTRDMAFYPADPALQAVAGLQALPAGYSRPLFGGGHGSGTSFSAYGALEYAVGTHLVLGAMLDLDRSDYYHPTTLLLYLRAPLAGDAVSLARPPRPVRPYADY